MRYNGSISLITVILWLLLFWDPPLEYNYDFKVGNYARKTTCTRLHNLSPQSYQIIQSGFLEIEFKLAS